MRHATTSRPSSEQGLCAQAAFAPLRPAVRVQKELEISTEPIRASPPTTTTTTTTTTHTTTTTTTTAKTATATTTTTTTTTRTATITTATTHHIADDRLANAQDAMNDGQPLAGAL